MGIAADLVLLTIDPDSGKELIGMTESDYVVGGALLMDLALSGRVNISEPAKKARVELIDAAPTGEAVLDFALSRIKPGKRPKASDVVARLGKGARKRLLDQLTEESAVRPRRDKVLGIFPVTHQEIVDRGRQDTLVRSVVDVLTGRTRPDDATAPLVALLSAGNAVKAFVDKPERKAAAQRAKSIAEGEWVGAASKAAIDAANAAVTASITAALVAAAATSGGSS